MLFAGRLKGSNVHRSAQTNAMPDRYAKYELLLDAQQSALEFLRQLEASCYIPETSQGKVIFQLCDEIGNHIVLPGSN